MKSIKNVSSSIIVQGTNNTVNIQNVSSGPQQPDPKIVTYFPPFRTHQSLFEGRSNFLKKLHSTLRTCAVSNSDDPLKRIVVIAGLGGIGKSSTAKQYGQVYGQHFYEGNVTWINAETFEGTKNGFFELARHFKLIVDHDGSFQGTPKNKLTPGSDSMKNLVRAVYQYFSTHVKNGLIIFDNANQIKSTDGEFGIQEFLPDENLKNFPLFLLTSRNRSWVFQLGHLTPILDLDILSGTESVEFFRKSFQIIEFEGNVKLLTDLGDLLGHYPLALTLAAAAISQQLELILGPLISTSKVAGNGQSVIGQRVETLETEIGSYIENFKRNGEKWLHYEMPPTFFNEQYDKIMATVWQATVDKIREGSGRDPNFKMATSLLNIIAFLPTDKLSVELCHAIFHEKPINSENFDDVMNNNEDNRLLIDTRKSFGVLERYSMVTMVTEEGEPITMTDGSDSSGKNTSKWTIRVHRLVQKWTREILKIQNDHKTLVQIANFLTASDLRNYKLIYWDYLHIHLRDFGWPDMAWCHSIYFGVNVPKCQEGYSTLMDVYKYFVGQPPDGPATSDSVHFDLCRLALAHYWPFPRLTLSDTNQLETRFLTGMGDTLGSVSVGQFLSLVLDMVLKNPEILLVQQFAINVVHAFCDLDYLQKKKNKTMAVQWVYQFHKFIQSVKTPMHPTFHDDISTMIKVTAKLLSFEKLMETLSSTTLSLLESQNGRFCWKFFNRSIEIACIFGGQKSGPTTTSQEEYNWRMFREGCGMDLWTKILAKFTSPEYLGDAFRLLTHRMMVGRTAKKMLKNVTFMNSLEKLTTQILNNSSVVKAKLRRNHNGCNEFLILDLAIFWFGVLAEKNHLRLDVVKRGMEVIGDFFQQDNNAGVLMQWVNLYCIYHVHHHQAILAAFLSSKDDATASIVSPVLFYLGQKFQVVLDEYYRPKVPPVVRDLGNGFFLTHL